MSLKRWHWIAIILTTVVLVVMAPSEDTTESKKVAGSANTSRNTSPSESGQERGTSRGAGQVDLELLDRLKIQRQERGKVSDVFNQTTLYVPPKIPTIVAPVIEAPPPVVQPTAPPMAFTYLGRYGDSDSRTVVLSKADRVYTVKVGDVIENVYRIERFTPGMVNFTYLPLGITQSLSTGE